MIGGAIFKQSGVSLMGEYASLVGEAILRQRTREAEHAARIEAELANRVKSEFISNMSHELRTPLNTMIGFSKLISEHDKRRLPDAEIVEYAKLINDAAGHLLSVINDILDISKLQSGRYTLDASEINVEDVLQLAYTANRNAAREAGVSLDLEVAANLPLIRGDAAKLRQAFHNIISNAIKFTLQGGAVKIEAIRLADGGVAVVIRDTGVGMSPDEVKLATTPFGQVDGKRTRWREGAGLGLPIARSLVELHGGQIRIQSEKGRGTEVGVILPSASTINIREARDVLLGNGGVS
ncbi:MAG: sensor histidine kinase [Hyphomicrobium sp.]|jgi:two-component system cell cycle sensor histidine kinase PleC|nr:sensor histidine kinase [Hyphomicrobium sp.]PPD06666.1 MAG: two-component sensor histidine kinase [Hyphomicrobium sp.]